jgi:Kef-type K+ transport system membrane component KefB
VSSSTADLAHLAAALILLLAAAHGCGFLFRRLRQPPVLGEVVGGLLETRFARIVLSTAVAEDILLYILLAIALALVGGGHGSLFGLPAMLHLQGASYAGLTYYTSVPLIFLALSMLAGPIVYRWASGLRYNLLSKANAAGYLLIVLLIMAVLTAALGVTPMFGALMAGIVTSQAAEEPDRPRRAIATFSFAFFIPIYFAIVGLKLDLIHSFPLRFFLPLLVFACTVKALSIFAAARLAGEPRASAVNLAVAMNARGGPGIVLASLAYEAKIINESFYAVLVMLSLVTSLLAGSWLDLAIRRGVAIR